MYGSLYDPLIYTRMINDHICSNVMGYSNLSNQHIGILALFCQNAVTVNKYQCVIVGTDAPHMQCFIATSWMRRLDFWRNCTKYFNQIVEHI